MEFTALRDPIYEAIDTVVILTEEDVEKLRQGEVLYDEHDGMDTCLITVREKI